MAYSLLYVSHSLVEPKCQRNSGFVGEIVQYSQRWNAEKQITGALIWPPGSSAQIIEGQPNRVVMLFARIPRDNRHSEVTLTRYQRRLKPGLSGLEPRLWRRVKLRAGAIAGLRAASL